MMCADVKGLIVDTKSLMMFVFGVQAAAEKDVSETWRKKNGLIRRERPAGRESPQQVNNGLQTQDVINIVFT